MNYRRKELAGKKIASGFLVLTALGLAVTSFTPRAAADEWQAIRIVDEVIEEPGLEAPAIYCVAPELLPPAQEEVVELLVNTYKECKQDCDTSFNRRKWAVRDACSGTWFESACISAGDRAALAANQACLTHCHAAITAEMTVYGVQSSYERITGDY